MALSLFSSAAQLPLAMYADATAEEFIDEILRYYVFFSNQRAQKENGGRVVDRKPTFFTRLFGTL